MHTKRLNIIFLVVIVCMTGICEATPNKFDFRKSLCIDWQAEMAYRRKFIQRWEDKKIKLKSFSKKFKISGVGIDRDVTEASLQATHFLNSQLEFYGQLSRKKGCYYSSYQGSLGINTHF